MANKTLQSADHAIYLTTHDGVTFAVKGAADGDFIQVTYDNDAVTGTEGAQGDVQWSQRKASLGTITAPTQWGANTNDRLNQVFKDQQAGLYLTKLEVKKINDTENVLIWGTDEARIMKVPDYATGTTAADRAWPFKVSGLTAGELETPA